MQVYFLQMGELYTHFPLSGNSGGRLFVCAENWRDAQLGCIIYPSQITVDKKLYESVYKVCYNLSGLPTSVLSRTARHNFIVCSDPVTKLYL